MEKNEKVRGACGHLAEPGTEECPECGQRGRTGNGDPVAFIKNQKKSLTQKIGPISFGPLYLLFLGFLDKINLGIGDSSI